MGESSNVELMNVKQLREDSHKMVDFIADYYSNVESFPVLSQVKPDYLRSLLPNSAPHLPETLTHVMEDVERKIMPGMTHWQSPGYFAYFPASTSVAGFLGEMLCSGLNVVGFSWITSPAATELELIVLDWLAKLLQLPKEFHSTGKGCGIIQGTACEAVLVVLVATRDIFIRKFGRRSLEKFIVYVSDQTHCSVKKACQIAGIYPENYRVLKTDASTNYALSPDVLEEAILDDLSKDLIPLFFCATVGTTSSTAVDPLLPLGKIAKKHGLWFHVDAAYAGNMCICPEFRHHLNGVELADSFNMNAHKSLFTSAECSPLWVKDRSALTQALSTDAEFLKNKASDSNMVVDFKDMQIPLSRRFRSLKLWMVLRLYGSEALQNCLRGHVNLAKHFENLVRQDSRFEVVTPRYFGLVCFRLVSPKGDINNSRGNELNNGLLDAVNSTGTIFISHTVLSERCVLRFATGGVLTEESHVNEAWKVIQEQASHLLCRLCLSDIIHEEEPIFQHLLKTNGNIDQDVSEDQDMAFSVIAKDIKVCN